ncbi:hypothetical protein CEUSTIGMA_g6047.t1 [Chlamydomonas eustigma]|uniref:non-specific serine/threonine protein kinase n=1 Tax=Chlamydomonas eustigma TaxID=1157962 RepID=A0A250X6A8_9CHLO|nr:hypothetical protein CEUSTIGMA_g6047.t1 [Chlamydomonas eustigma]|eukprot:GAX78608.1 hypothetical protein CEUSTIGMA_g6047.t1 [Chlamydomonas eustigma]
MPSLFSASAAENGQSDTSSVRSFPPSISPGDVLNHSRYKIDSLYGESISCEFWKAMDLKNEGRQVMIKVAKDGSLPGFNQACYERDMTLAAQFDFNLAEDADEGGLRGAEAADRSSLRSTASSTSSTAGSQPVVRCLDAFELYGPTKACHSFMTAHGHDVWYAVMTAHGHDVWYAVMTAHGHDVWYAVMTAHGHDVCQRGIMHMDLCPDNILLRAPFQTSFEMETWDLIKLQASNVMRSLFHQQPVEPHFKQVPLGTITESNLHRAKMVLSDFGRAKHIQLLNLPQISDSCGNCELPEFRPPEEILELVKTPSYDTWQLGLMVWWMATGSPLFNPQPKTLEQLLPAENNSPSNSASTAFDKGDLIRQQSSERSSSTSAHPCWEPASDIMNRNPREALRKGMVRGALAYDVNEMHLAAMVAMLGRFSSEMVEASPIKRMYFRKSGRLKMEANVAIQPVSLEEILVNGYKFNEAEATSLASFVKPLLELDPLKRPEPAELLSHPWLVETSKSKDDKSDDASSSKQKQAVAMEDPGIGRRLWWSPLVMLRKHRGQKQQQERDDEDRSLRDDFSNNHQIITLDPSTVKTAVGSVTFSDNVAEARGQNMKVSSVSSVFSESLVSDELVT